MVHIINMLVHPKKFFDEFPILPPKGAIAFLGYYLMSFSTLVIGMVENPVLELSLLFTLIICFASAFIGAVLYRLFYGYLWYYRGSKIFGGQALRSEIGDAIGYVLVIPGLLGILGAFIAVVSYWIGDETVIAITALCMMLPISLVTGIFLLVYTAIAIKQLNGFGWGKTVGVIVWLPVLMMIFGAVLALASYIF